MGKINYKWYSAKAYSEATGLGQLIVKQFIRDGKLEGEQTEDGYWKVKVYDDDAASKKELEYWKERALKSEAKLDLMKSMILEESSQLNTAYKS